ncbi:MAG TPA: sigma-70 family RNA polymerase sigma factor [Chloroflexaceae bacterium]|nr:sigma-70 family RNA polymerase sigma factor [Chloroflexaceae bacterium]
MARPDPDLEQRCAEIAARLIARHGWRLIEEAEFARRIVAAQAELGDADLQYTAYGVYNSALYLACAGAEGAERREQAYGELFRMLYERAWKSYPDVCADATQLALVEVIARFGACHEPRAFIPFAFRYLMGAARTLRRREGRATSLEREVGDEGLTLGDTIADSTDIEGEAVAREQRGALHRFLARYIVSNPRARKQIDAVRLKYLAGLDDERISRELGVSVPSVHVLRSRGLTRLRSAPGWRQYWERDL